MQVVFVIMELDLSKTEWGNDILSIGGHQFRKRADRRGRNGEISWRCRDQKKFKCSTTVKTLNGTILRGRNPMWVQSRVGAIPCSLSNVIEPMIHYFNSVNNLTWLESKMQYSPVHKTIIYVTKAPPLHKTGSQRSQTIYNRSCARTTTIEHNPWYSYRLPLTHFKENKPHVLGLLLSILF